MKGGREEKREPGPAPWLRHNRLEVKKWLRPARKSGAHLQLTWPVSGGRDENSSRPQAPEGALGIRYGGCPRQVRCRVFPLSSSDFISINGLRSSFCCSIFISHLLFAPAGV